MKQKALKYFLAITSFIVAFFLWWSINRAINIEDSSTWLMPIVWSSLFFIFFSLTSVLVKRKWLLDLLLLACFSLIFIFSFNLIQAVLIIFSLLFSFLAIGRFRRDMKLNIKVDLRKTLGTGTTFFVVALAIAICGQYYSGIRNLETSKIFPRLKIDSLTGSMTNKIIEMINPDFASLSNDQLTVDQFILEIQKKKMAEMGAGDISGIANGGDAALSALKNGLLESSQNLAIQEGRKQFSEIAGRTLTGQEKVSDIFSELINNKINDFISPNLAKKSGFPIVPFILAILLFLTIVPMGNFFASFWTWICFFIFWLFKKFGFVVVNKIPSEIEVIE